MEEVNLGDKMARLDVDGFVHLQRLEWTRALGYSLEEVDLGDKMARLDVVDGLVHLQWLADAWRGDLRLD